MPDENPTRGPEPAPSRLELAIEFLTRRFLSIVFVGVVAVLAAGAAGLEIPTWVNLAGAAMLMTAPIGHFAFSQIRTRLPAPPMAWVVDVDLLDDTGAGVYRFPVQDFNDLEVTDGSLWNPSPALYFGKDLDLEAGTISGVWRGSRSDGELLRDLHLVHEVRGSLEDHARRGSRIENQAFTIVRNATRAQVKNVVSTFEKGTLPDGDAIDDEIESAIEDFGLDQLVSADQPDPDEETASQMEFNFNNVSNGEEPEPVEVTNE